MIVALASATGCIRVDDLTPTTAAEKLAAAPVTEDTPAGLHMFATCKDGKVPRHRAAACLTLAGYYERGVFGLPHDPARAAQLRESAADMLVVSCEGGEVADCSRAAAAIGTMIPPSGDPGSATAEPARWMIEYAEEGCRGGDVGGCVLLALIHEQGRGVAPDREKAAVYLDTACSGGHRRSCLVLAARAEGAAAVRAYERACRMGSGFGCATAAEHHRKGVGTEASTAKAGPLFERGCSLGDPASCVLGAEMYADASPPAPRRAAQLARTGCDQDIAGACLFLGELLDRNPGPRRSYSSYLRACELGEERGCAAAAAQRPRTVMVEGVEEDVVESGE